MKVAVLFHRLGPYHFARLKAANELCQLHVIEFSSVDDTYAWDVVDDEQSFIRTTLFTDSDVDKKPSCEIVAALRNAFTFIEPDAVAIPGWSGRSVFLALALCRKMRIPIIAMSASTEIDQVRHWWSESIKKRIVWNFSTSLVGGRPHSDYMHKLGMPRDRIFSGYDAVDNDYFSVGAINARKNEKQLRDRHNLPENYFLGSNRFIPKKNIDRLIRAYAEYRDASASSGIWKLVLLGDGELRTQIENLVSALGLGNDVFLPGFKQYQDLPIYYGLANAYVHASTTEQWGLVVNEAMASSLPVLVSERCGCAADLVENGRNGFTFDPYDVEELAGLMMKLSSGECDVNAMGEASWEIIAGWGTDNFAKNLIRAVEVALNAPTIKPTLFDTLILKGLGMR